MRHIACILLLTAWSLAMDGTGGLKDRLSKLKRDADRMTVQQTVPEEVPVPVSVPATVSAAPASAAAAPDIIHRSRNEIGLTHGERIVRIEERVAVAKEALVKLQGDVDDLKDILAVAVATMEAQTKVMADNKSSSDRSEIIINIILGVFGMLLTGGVGRFAWKNKQLVFKRVPKSDLSGTSVG